MKKSDHNNWYWLLLDTAPETFLDPNYDWSQHHTREVLGMLRSDRGQQPDIKPILKKVLAGREHIPTKQEAKRLRQEKAKAKRHR